MSAIAQQFLALLCDRAQSNLRDEIREKWSLGEKSNDMKAWRSKAARGSEQRERCASQSFCGCCERGRKDKGRSYGYSRELIYSAKEKRWISRVVFNCI